jgi:hypothetical protein
MKYNLPTRVTTNMPQAYRVSRRKRTEIKSVSRIPAGQRNWKGSEGANNPLLWRLARAPVEFERQAISQQGVMVVEADILLWRSLTRTSRKRGRGKRAGKRKLRREQAAMDAALERERLFAAEEAARVNAAVNSRVEVSPWSGVSAEGSLSILGDSPQATLARTASALIATASSSAADLGTRVRCERCGSPLTENGTCPDHTACVRKHVARTKNLRRGGKQSRGRGSQRLLK